MSPEVLGDDTRALAWLLGPAHLELCDAEGRPIGERAAAAYERAPKDERRTDFGDARDATGRLCNHAALAQIERAYKPLVAALRGLCPGEPNTLARVHRRVSQATARGPLRALRGRPLAPEDGALFKLTVGFCELVRTALLEGWWDAEAAPPDDATLLEWLDERGWLIGDVQVCAGSRRQIAGVWRVLASDGPSADAAAWEADASRALLELEALAAAAAGAARAHELGGGSSAAAATASAALIVAERPPRLVDSLRQVPDAGALHPTLLFEPDAVPESLRALVAGIAAAPSGDPLPAVDAALARAAEEPARRLFVALERRGAVDVLEALRACC